MNWFECRNQSEAVVKAPRQAIWDVLSDPKALAALTPMVKNITAKGNVWKWRLIGIEALGVNLVPEFTELMEFDEPTRIVYTHRPPKGEEEMAGANGVYLLEERGPDATFLSIDITLSVRLPLPKMAGPVVRRTMAAMMNRTGDAFAKNLAMRLDIDP